MVRGFESFKNWFQGYEEQYTIIGGTACSILMAAQDMDFRATKDIDLVLILEAMTADFGVRFWEYIVEGKYQHCNKSTGEPQFYRFSQPQSGDFPAMIELFSRKIDGINLSEDAVLTPLPIDDDISSLSAVLLNDAYYEFLRNGKIVIDGVTVLGAEYLIPFKAKAWLDLSDRKSKGEQVDSRNIRKHKNDVFRLTELLSSELQILVPGAVIDDIKSFINRMQAEDIDLKQLGIVGRSKQDILDELSTIYISFEK